MKAPMCYICGKKATDRNPLEFVAYWRIKGEDTPVWLHAGKCTEMFNE